MIIAAGITEFMMCGRDLRWKRTIFKSNNEPALVAFQGRAVEALGTGYEVAPRRSQEDDRSRGEGRG